MPQYWLDASVFIELHRKYHPVNRALSFWSWMAKKVDEGSIVCPKCVYKEIAEDERHQDALAQWVKIRKERGLCIPPSKAVQTWVGKMEAYVFGKYAYAEAWDFSRGGDCWVIAHALAENGTVVTKESTLHPEAKKARIPDVCKKFDVACIDTVAMLELLDAKY